MQELKEKSMFIISCHLNLALVNMGENRLKKHGKKLPLILYHLKQITKKEMESPETKRFSSKKRSLCKKDKSEK